MSEAQHSGAENGWHDVQPRHVFTVAVLLLAGLILYAARASLGPYILGITLAYILLPVVRLIEALFPDRGPLSSTRRPIATLLAVVLAIGFVAVLLTLIARPVVDEVQALADSFPEYWQDLTEGETFGDWYVENVPDDIRMWLDENVGSLGQGLLGGSSAVLSYLFQATGTVIEAIVAFVIVPVFMAYVLIDRPQSEERMRSLLPEHWADDTIAIARLADGIMAAYTKGVIISSVVVGVITAAGYWLIGIDLWVSLGVIAFLGEIVPILGPWIAFFISFPVILVTQPDKAILAVLVFGVIQALEGWFISPKIQSASIEFPATLVLLSLAIGGAIGGAIGIILALPAAAILRALVVYTLRRIDGLRPDPAAAGLLPAYGRSADQETEGLLSEI
jgi:predicted PurR-regulated permease PerM